MYKSWAVPLDVQNSRKMPGTPGMVPIFLIFGSRDWYADTHTHRQTDRHDLAYLRVPGVSGNRASAG